MRSSVLFSLAVAVDALTVGVMPLSSQRAAVRMGGADTSKTYDYKTGITPGYSGERVKFTPSSRTVGIKGVSGVRFDVVGDISSSVAEAVTYYGKRAIASKGSFSLCIPGGSIVKACGAISKDALDWSKVYSSAPHTSAHRTHDAPCLSHMAQSTTAHTGTQPIGR
jgi:hypothetical protein